MEGTGLPFGIITVPGYRYHPAMAGDKEGYYRAFADKPLQHLARSLAEGFAYQGEQFVLHDKPRGEKSSHLPPEATIFLAQNHDQVGNRALGERLSRLVGSVKLRQAMAITLLSPHIPLLFMGEEAAAETPFLFFCDWEGEAADLTREGSFASSTLVMPELESELVFASEKLGQSAVLHPNQVVVAVGR